MTAPALSPAATALLNAIAAATPASDPWARFPPVLTVSHVAEILGSTGVHAVARASSLNGTPGQVGAGTRGHTMGTHGVDVADLADAATRAYLRRRPAARRHLDDLRQSVAVALLTALPRWDPRRGAASTFLSRRADGAVLDAVRSEMRRRPEALDQREPAALDPALAAVDARLDAAALLSRLDPRTADLLRRVYADGESLRAAGRAVGVSQTRAHQVAHEGIAAVRG